jgi:cytoskeletal protein CcmA (bactofilin family)
MNKVLRPSVAMAAALVMLLIVATLVLAESRLLGGKLRSGDSVTVPESERVAGDLYIAAGTAVVDGSVEGDLVAVGGQVTVNGDVGGDLLAAGGTISINGAVAGDVRAAGGQVSVGGAVTEDVVLAGGQLTLASDGSVGGDLVTSGGTVSVAGDVTGNIEANAGSFDRSGELGGQQHVTIMRGAEQPLVTTSDRVLDAIRQFVVLLILGGLAIWLVPRALRSADGTLRSDPLLSLAGGLLTLLGYLVFIIATILLVILLAIALGVAQLFALVAIEAMAGVLALFVGSFLLLLTVAFFADLVVGLTLGRLVASSPLTNRWQELGVLAAGVAVVVVVTSLPVIGGLAKLAVVCFGLGAISLALWRRWRGAPTQPAPTPPTATPTAA